MLTKKLKNKIVPSLDGGYKFPSLEDGLKFYFWIKLLKLCFLLYYWDENENENTEDKGELEFG